MQESYHEPPISPPPPKQDPSLESQAIMRTLHRYLEQFQRIAKTPIQVDLEPLKAFQKHFHYALEEGLYIPSRFFAPCLLIGSVFVMSMSLNLHLFSTYLHHRRYIRKLELIYTEMIEAMPPQGKKSR